jgi:hypothetical protein
LFLKETDVTDHLPPQRYALWHLATEWPNEDGEFVGARLVPLSCGHSIVVGAAFVKNRKREWKCLTCRNKARDAIRAESRAAVDMTPVDVEVVVTRKGGPP